MNELQYQKHDCIQDKIYDILQCSYIPDEPHCLYNQLQKYILCKTGQSYNDYKMTIEFQTHVKSISQLLLSI